MSEGTQQSPAVAGALLIRGELDAFTGDTPVCTIRQIYLELPAR